MGAMKDFDRRIRQGSDDAIAAVAELWEAREKILFDITDAFTKARWIPVSERLPELGLSVIGVGGESSPREMWLDLNHQWHMADGSEVDLVTHWMPLPEPPEVK